MSQNSLYSTISSAQPHSPNSPTASFTGLQQSPQDSIPLSQPPASGSHAPSSADRHQSVPSNPRRKKVRRGLRQLWDLKLSLSLSPDPPPGRRPGKKTAIICIAGFLAITVTVAICATAPTTFTRYFVAAIGLLLVVGLLVLNTWDIRKSAKSGREYSRNRGNTAVTVVVASILFVVLYVWSWYPAFHTTSFSLRYDEVKKIAYPSIALFTRDELNSQAELNATGNKCFVGWYDDTAPNCSSWIAPSSPNCKCDYLYSESKQSITYANATYQVFKWSEGSQIFSTTPFTMLWLQVYFNYDATKAKHDFGWTPSPGVSIAFHDPQLTLEQALNYSRTRLFDIDAAAVNTINMDLRYFVELQRPTAYDYDISIETRTAKDLVCNTGDNYKNWTRPCVLNLQIHFPSFRRTVIEEKKDLSWSQFAVEAGAWFSFAQLLGWLLSGAAFTA
ncbi:hypothetical protein H2200_006708 [Cladophialophora chaetospira]|uniref:Uncharacterized protein n=1 Tax=Cladophialophora chaetospira TaxID=386627 RepID=A0AA39CHG1_9EURO|nr:hypothetical protein H2200_006708 [Cladophialophora chaetospira]